MKKTALLLALLLALSGCSPTFVGRRQRIDEVDMVLTLGIDAGEDIPDGYRVTLVTRKSGGAGDSASGDSLLTVGEGRTISQALADMSAYQDRDSFLGHVTFLVLGEGVLHRGLDGVLDFFLRSSRIQTGVQVLAARSGTAYALLNTHASGGEFITEKLDQLTHNASLTAMTSLPVTCTTLYSGLLADRDFLIPALTTLPSSMPGGEPGLCLSGCGVFRGGRLAAWLTPEECRGCLWFRDEVSYMTLECAGEKGVTALTLMENRVSLEAGEGDEPSFTLRIHVRADVSQQEGSVSGEADFPALEREGAALLTRQAEAALALCRSREVDCLGLGALLADTRPALWERVKGDWRSRLADLPVEIQVTLTIRSTLQLAQPKGGAWAVLQY